MPAPVEATISGLKVETIPLLFETAQPLIPVIAEILSIASADLMEAVKAGHVDLKGDLTDPAVAGALLPALRNVSSFLTGRLESLAPKILATTRVAAPIASGEIEWHELAKPKDRSYIFDEYPQIYFPTLFHAGSVSFRRFFPDLGGRGRGARKSPSKDLSQNT